MSTTGFYPSANGTSKGTYLGDRYVGGLMQAQTPELRLGDSPQAADSGGLSCLLTVLCDIDLHILHAKANF